MPGDDDSVARLERIKQLWLQLQSIREDSPQYDELIECIRREAELFRRSQENDTPKS